MIEKLIYGWEARNLARPEPSNEEICQKLNELIDEINEIKKLIEAIS